MHEAEQYLPGMRQASDCGSAAPRAGAGGSHRTARTGQGLPLTYSPGGNSGRTAALRPQNPQTAIEAGGIDITFRIGSGCAHGNAAVRAFRVLAGAGRGPAANARGRGYQAGRL